MAAGNKTFLALIGFALLLAAGGVVNAQEKFAKAADEVLADLTKSGSPGCALAVARGGKIIYEKGYGRANIEDDVEITSRTVFDIGSTSKQFTAASILLLEKQGKLSVQDDIRKYLPEIPDYGNKITILHLLNHTSGLRDYLALFELAGMNIDSVTTDQDALAILARQKALNFEPGSDWLYSNSGFFLLSVIVKRASGKTLREFATENIFEPLQMKQTIFRDEHTLLVPNRALAYDSKDAGAGYTLDVSYFEQTGDGAVHTSVEDLLKWDENFYSGQIGGKEFLSEIQEPGKLNSGKVLDYAKGLRIADYCGLRTVSHGGSWGGYRAELLRFPEQHFSVACLCNLGSASPSNRARRVADIYLASGMKPREEKKKESAEVERKKGEMRIAEEQLRDYLGDYSSAELRVSYRLEAAEGKLKLTIGLPSGAFGGLGNNPQEYLRATGTDEFEFGNTGIAIHFRRDAEHHVTGFMLDAGRTRGLIVVRTLPGKY